MINFKDQKIAIVGGAGFVGSNLAQYLIDHYTPKHIQIIDNFLSSETDNITKNDNISITRGSIISDEVLNTIPHDTDYVFHLACFHGNQSSIHDPMADHENNTLTSLKLFNHLSTFSNLKAVVYSSAGCAAAKKTFSTPEATSEDTSPSLFQDSPYSISKLIGEMYGNYFQHKCNLPFITARFQNVYGPGEILGAGKWRGTPHTVWRNVIPTFIWKAIHNEPLPVENGGVSTRDFIYVTDIVRGLVACSLKGQPGEVYNLATGIQTSINDLANLINDLTHNKAGTGRSTARQWDRSGKRFGATEKSKTSLDFESNITIEDGIKQTIDWTTNNRIMISKAMSKHKGQYPELRNYLLESATHNHISEFDQA